MKADLFMQGLFLLLVAAAYFSGSIPFGKLLGYYYGVDIQKQGSGNIGFANAVRVLGFRPALLVLTGDVLKGFIPVFLAVPTVPVYQIQIIAATAVAGHLFPVWLKFKGGKGIATGLGVTLAINPLLGAIGFGMYLAVISIAKKSGVASVLSAWMLPLFSMALAPAYTAFYFGMALMATWTHRNNLRQLKKELAYDK